MIVGHLRRQPVPSQERLVELLADGGIRVTQATLSRDLAELGVVKGPAGYMLAGDAPQSADGGLERALRAMLVGGAVGGSLAVLHTGPGRASALALEIDRAGLKPVLGTVAGDDTIFVAARSAKEAMQLVGRFKTLAGIA